MSRIGNGQRHGESVAEGSTRSQQAERPSGTPQITAARSRGVPLEPSGEDSRTGASYGTASAGPLIRFLGIHGPGWACARGSDAGLVTEERVSFVSRCDEMTRAAYAAPCIFLRSSVGCHRCGTARSSQAESASNGPVLAGDLCQQA